MPLTFRQTKAYGKVHKCFIKEMPNLAKYKRAIAYDKVPGNNVIVP